MSFEDISFSPVLLAELYKNNLVQVTETVPVIQAPRELPPLKFLGENKKNILLVVQDATAPFLNEKSFNFLLAILSACQLNMSDVALINRNGLQLSITDIITNLKCTKVLVFGVEAKELELPVEFPPYQVQKHGAITYLTSDNFDVLDTDKQRKAKLWACLKKIFEL